MNFFEKKLGSGGYGAVYLAKNKTTGVKVAVKAMQKGKITDYESFQNEINILMNLVSKHVQIAWLPGRCNLCRLIAS